MRAQNPVLPDTLRPPAKPQLRVEPPATRPGAAVYKATTFDQVVEMPSRLTAGLSLGWGAPYAVGVELAYRFRPAVDANLGVGLGSSGAKLGAGARAYVPSRTQNHLFVGTNVVYSVADVELDLDDHGVMGRYFMHSSVLLHLRAGLHHQFRRNALQFAVGYGIVLGPNPVIELVPGYGPGTAMSRRLVGIAGPGGVEVSISYLLAVGRSKRTIR